ncbi:MAG: hypothetical protein ACK4HD_14050 [Pannonibacter phragmitetus]
MPVKVMNVPYGEMVQIGDTPEAGACVRVEDVSGRRVKLVIATDLVIYPPQLGLFPQTFAPGLGARKHVA